MTTTATPLRVLIIEDSEDDALLLLRELRKEGLDVSHARVDTAEAMQAALAEGGWDVVLSDHVMPRFNGLDALRLLRQTGSDLPFILVSGKIGEETAVEAMKAGANDFVMKDRLGRLALAVRRELNEAVIRRQKQRAEEELRESGRRLATLMGNLPGMAYRCRNDRDWTMEFVSEGCAALTGYLPGDLIRNRMISYGDIIHPDDQDAVWDSVQRAIGKRHPFRLEYRIRAAGGEVRWVWEQGRAVFGPGEEVLALEGFITDVTESKTASEALRIGEQRLRLTTEAGNVGLWDWNLETNDVYFTPVWKRQLGYEDDGLAGRFESWEERLHPDDRKRITDLLKACLADPTIPYHPEIRLRHRDGSYRWFLAPASFVFDDRGKPARMLGAHIDITERKQAEERLLRLNRTLRLLTECNSALVRASQESELLETICGVLTGHGGYPLAWVGFAERDEARTVRPAHWTGEASGYAEGIRVSYADEPYGRGATGTAIRTGRPAYFPSFADDPRLAAFRDRAARFGLGSCVGLPLRSRAGTFGALTIFSRSEDAFDEDEIALLEELANDLAYGIESLRTEAERRRVDQALRASEARYRAIAETAADAIVSMDQEGSIIAWNRAASGIFGYSAEEVLGKPVTMLMPERFRDAHRQGLARFMETGVPRIIGRTLELEGRNRNGREFPVEISLSTWSSEGGTFFSGIIRDISERKRYLGELERHANYDALTGLANRNLLQDRIRQAIARAARSGHGVAVLLLNLDRLKLVNESLGHEAGDAVLRTVAARLAARTGEEDTVARLSGDEFVVVLSDVAEEYAVSRLARTLLEAMAEPIGIGDQELSITCSVGAGIFPKDGADLDTLLRNANAAMRRAKEQGQDRLQFFAQEMNARATQWLRVQTGLARALERGELRLHYQPLVDLLSGRVDGVEALLRWQTADGMLLLPADFIAVAEETDLISALGAWALEQACRQALQWRERFDPDLRVAVNVSSVQIRDGTLAGAVRHALQGSGLPPEALEIEITESSFLTQAEENRKTLQDLKDLGLSFAIDDFGTHYAGLSFIRYFPVHRVKVDKYFIREIATHAGDAAISRAIIAMAHGLEMKVTAEGVETEAQLTMLRRLRFDEAQGNYFSPAVPAEEMERQFGVPVRRFKDDSAARTLLLVDDEMNMLTALRRALRREGYRILLASSAREALDLLATEKVDVVISDQRMPEMTGTELLGRVKLMHPETVRIVLSGHTDLSTVTDAINRGAVYKFITKPWEDGMLRDTLREAFERHEES